MLRASAFGRPALAIALAGALLSSVARLAGAAVPAFVLLGWGAALVAVVGAGVAFFGSGVFARPIVAAAKSRAAGRFALTFDDGPDPEQTRHIVDLLEARGHRATFFVIGARAEKEAALVAEMARRGHAIENHSYAHPRFATLSAAGSVARDLDRASAVIESATGRRPRFFRPPVGLLSPPVVEAARRAGLALVGWSKSARDGTARATADTALRRLVAGLHAGAILVLHDGAERGNRRPIAAAVLPRLLDAAAARGLKSVTLGELLEGDEDGARIAA